MKEYFCIGSCLPFQNINKSAINNSTAKQTFSFGRSKRFKDIKANCKQVSYSTNQFKVKKTGATLGSSDRVPIVVPQQGPSPGHYRVRTQMFHDNKYFSFGLGRQNVKAYDYLNIQSVKYPSATKYDIDNKIKVIMNKQPSYSLKKRHITEYANDYSPGPARYNLLAGKNNNLTMTKYKSITFSTGKGRRFQNQQTQVPGVGSYQTLERKSQRIGGGISKFSQFQGSKFPSSKRKSYIDDCAQRNKALPGPGNYRTASQFGQYDGNVYQNFQLSHTNKTQGRPQTASYLLNLQSNLKNRPRTSKG